MRRLFSLVITGFILTGIFYGCNLNATEVITQKSSVKALTGFYFSNPVAFGTVNETSHTVAVTVPYGTGVSALIPSVFHTGKSINPASGAATNFTNPVTYTVEAEDGSKQDYIVTVTPATSNARAITSFNFTSPASSGTINENTHTIRITVPNNTDITSLAPLITHTGASIIPSSGVSQNFTSPVTYTVTAADNSKQDYIVTVAKAKRTDKAITGFYFLAPAVNGTINETDHSISLTVPYGTDVTSLNPVVIHTGTGISPAAGTSRNFTNPVNYTVTAADGSQQMYKVTVKSVVNNSRKITAFDFTSPAVTGTISESNHSIQLIVPYGTDITSLAPSIVHTGVSVIPLSGTIKDFTNPVVYTVTAADGSTQSYTASVRISALSSRAITAFNLTSPVTTGAINESNHTISLNVIPGTIVTALVPSITHTGSSITPLPGAAKDFTNPVIYTVRAANGSVQSYTASVIVSPPSNITNLNAANGYSKVVFQWTPPADANFTGVEITAVPAITPVTVLKGTNTAEITGLINGTSYTFTVKAVVSNGDKSTGVTATAIPDDKCNVLYYGNNNLSGTVPTDGNTYNVDDTITVLSNSGGLAKIPAAGTGEAYKFGGWNTKPDGSGTTYAAGIDTIPVTEITTIVLYAKWVKYDLRDTGPAGGYVFYDKGSFTNGWRYLEAAPSDCPQTEWGKTEENVNGTSTGLGSGKDNTVAILTYHYVTHPYTMDTAAKKCDDLTVTYNGITYDDWFLPSKDELGKMYSNLKANGVGNFTTAEYWSSTEELANFADVYYFSNGTTGYTSKMYAFWSRASRRF